MILTAQIKLNNRIALSMSAHHAYIEWRNSSDRLDYQAYDRSHLWKFRGGTLLKASAAVEFLGKQEFVNPEEAFVASLSSCHLLTFLAIASRKGYVVSSYTDHAVGYLEKNSNGRMAVTRVVLDPEITFTGQSVPAPEIVQKMHEQSHKECFIANSVTTEVSVKIK